MTVRNTGKAPVPMRPVPLPSAAPATPPCPGIFRQAGTANREDRFLDPDLTAHIDVHLAEHGTDGVTPHARALLIVGKPGDTKTSTVRSQLSRRGVDALELSMAHFSGPTEGRAVEHLDAVHAYIRAKTAETGQTLVLHGHDADASVLFEHHQEERTINSRLLRGALQTLLDGEDTFRDGNARPIPIIFTANRTDGLPGPLIREGRVRLVRYAPSWQRKAQMLIAELGAKTALDRRRLQCLAFLHRDRSVVWLTSLAADVRHAAIAHVVATRGLDAHDAIRAAANPNKLDVRALFRAAKARHQASTTSEEPRT
jgi:hypothetical protein